MIHENLRDRTFAFALAATEYCRRLPNTWDALRIRRQLFDCATSVAANYRAAGRARSRAEFIAKLGLVVEEADEADFWLDLLRKSNIDASLENTRLAREAANFALSLSRHELPR